MTAHESQRRAAPDDDGVQHRPHVRGRPADRLENLRRRRLLLQRLGPPARLVLGPRSSGGRSPRGPRPAPPPGGRRTACPAVAAGRRRPPLARPCPPPHARRSSGPLPRVDAGPSAAPGRDGARRARPPSSARPPPPCAAARRRRRPERYLRPRRAPAAYHRPSAAGRDRAPGHPEPGEHPAARLRRGQAPASAHRGSAPVPSAVCGATERGRPAGGRCPHVPGRRLGAPRNPPEGVSAPTCDRCACGCTTSGPEAASATVSTRLRNPRCSPRQPPRASSSGSNVARSRVSWRGEAWPARGPVTPATVAGAPECNSSVSSGSEGVARSVTAGARPGQGQASARGRRPSRGSYRRRCGSSGAAVSPRDVLPPFMDASAEAEGSPDRARTPPPFR